MDSSTLQLVAKVERTLLQLRSRYGFRELSNQAFWDLWAVEEAKLPSDYGWSAALNRVIGPDWPQVRQ